MFFLLYFTLSNNNGAGTFLNRYCSRNKPKSAFAKNILLFSVPCAEKTLFSNSILLRERVVAEEEMSEVEVDSEVDSEVDPRGTKRVANFSFDNQVRKTKKIIHFASVWGMGFRLRRIRII